MIILCPWCEKSFDVAENLIPENGRLLKCGSCSQTWFYNKNNQENVKPEKIISSIKSEKKKTSIKSSKKINKFIYKDLPDLPVNKGSELVKYEPKQNLSFGKILSYLIVLILSFVAVIIFLDTFKVSLSTFFPGLELTLYNLFETLKDLVLFIKDLN